MSEFLLELRFNDADLSRRISLAGRLGLRYFEELMSRGLGLGELRSGLNDRRLALQIRGLPGREPEREFRLLGPLVREAFVGGKPGAKPTPQLEEFLEESGLPIEAFELIDTERGRRLAFIQLEPGRLIGPALAALTVELVTESAELIGSGLEGIFALCDGVPLKLELTGIEASPPSFDDTGAIEVKSAEDYFARLAERGVLLESLADLRNR